MGATLRELAAELLQEFPQEVPSARELQQQLQPGSTQLVELAPSTSSLKLISLEPEATEREEAKIATVVYIFKVSWHQIWRRIAISSDMTLWDLSQLILRSVNFESDRLDLFSYQDRSGQTIQVVHPDIKDAPSTEDVELDALSLKVGSTMNYLFDFEDNWEFELELEKIRLDDLRCDYVEILEYQGKAPEQYPDWSEY